MTTSVIVRVDEQLKRKLKAYGVNLSEVTRSALEREVERREREALLASLGRSKKVLSKVSDEDLVSSVKLSRQER